MLVTRPRFRLIPVLLLSFLAVRPALGRAAWVPLGPEGGTIEALAFAPSASNGVYAATLGGGVFASADGGLSWRRTGGQLAGRTGRSTAPGPGAFLTASTSAAPPPRSPSIPDPRRSTPAARPAPSRVVPATASPS